MLDPDRIATFIILAISVLGWLMTQAGASAKNRRSELRYRRRSDGMKDQYIYRLERALQRHGDDPYGLKPSGYDELEEAEW